MGPWEERGARQLIHTPTAPGAGRCRRVSRVSTDWFRTPVGRMHSSGADGMGPQVGKKQHPEAGQDGKVGIVG